MDKKRHEDPICTAMSYKKPGGVHICVKRALNHLPLPCETHPKVKVLIHEPIDRFLAVFSWGTFWGFSFCVRIAQASIL